jgi:hypothetical protein
MPPKSTAPNGAHVTIVRTGAWLDATTARSQPTAPPTAATAVSSGQA